MKRISAALALAFASSTAAAQIPPPGTEAMLELEMLVRSYVARHPGVSIDDAVSRMAIQSELAPVAESLREEFAERLTDISIQHDPDQHILVELKGPGSVPNRVARTPSGATRVVFEAGHRYTNEEFHQVLDRHMSLIYSEIPGITGSSGFPGEDRVLIYISGDADQADRLKDTIAKLERLLGFKISLRPNMPKSMNMAAPMAGGGME